MPQQRLPRDEWRRQQVEQGLVLKLSGPDEERTQIYNKCDADAKVLARWLLSTYGLDRLNEGSGVLDVAGGVGELSACLALLGVKSTCVDPRPTVGCLSTRRRKALAKAAKSEKDTGANCKDWPMIVPFSSAHAWYGRAPGDDLELANAGLFVKFKKYATGKREMHEFKSTEDLGFDRITSGNTEGAFEAPFVLGPDHDLLKTCSIVVGLHPDQATDDVPQLAERHGKAFVIVPCCVFADDHTHRVIPGKDDKGEVEGTFRPARTLPELVQWLALALDRVQSRAGGREQGGREQGGGGASEERERVVDTLDFCGANTAIYTKQSGSGVTV